MPFSVTHPTSLPCRLRRKASPFMSSYCQVSFALLIRHVFQVLIITVFVLITSTAPGAKFHTHKHQLPSLFSKVKSQLSRWGTPQCRSWQGRCRHRACTVHPVPELPQDPWGRPQERCQKQSPLPRRGLAGSALRDSMQRCPHRHPTGCMAPGGC